MNNRELHAPTPTPTLTSASRKAAHLLGAFCLAFLSTLIPVISAQAASAETAPPDQQVPPVQVQGHKVPVGPHCVYLNLATVPVKSSGRFLTIKGGLNGNAAIMLLDTGTLHTVLTEQEAKTLGLQLAHSKYIDTDADGKMSATYATRINDVSLDKFFWHGVKLEVVQHIPDSYSVRVGADILLNGWKKDIEFALANKQLKIFVPSSGCNDTFLAYWDDNASVVPLVDLSPQDSRQIVTVKINGKEMTAMLDSGAPISMINLEAAARVGITPQSAGVNPLGYSGSTKQHGEAWTAPFESFTIGDETIKNPTIGITDLWGPVPSDSSSSLQSGLRLMSIAPQKGGNGVIVTPGGDALGQIGSFKSEAPNGDRPDMVLGADFLRTHRVLLAISQNRLYFTYLGGKVFGSNADPQVSVAEAARIASTASNAYALNP